MSTVATDERLVELLAADGNWYRSLDPWPTSGNAFHEALQAAGGFVACGIHGESEIFVRFSLVPAMRYVDA